MTLPFYHSKNSFGLRPNPNPADTPNPQSETYQQQSQPVKWPATGSHDLQERCSTPNTAPGGTSLDMDPAIPSTPIVKTISTDASEIDLSDTSQAGDP
jgi:hypothetical protein